MDEKKKESLAPPLFRRLLAGALAGLTNGLFGAGGGMVAVPALTGICGLEEKDAHASAISIILPLSAVSGAIYAINGNVDYTALIFTAPALTLGSFLGAKLLSRLPVKWVECIFNAIMLATGIWMLV